MRISSRIIASTCPVRYTIGMRSKTGFRIAGCKPIGLVFALVLFVMQVYPAFGACLCPYEAQEAVEISASSEAAPSCRSAAPATREEMDSGTDRCSREVDSGGSNSRISRDECCGVEGGWTPPLSASLSRTVEVRPAFDAMSWIYSEDAGALFPRFDRLARGTNAGFHGGPSTTIYLLNASLLI